MTRRARITLLIVLAVALFALIVGGFFWPRPQMERGPWAGPDTTRPASRSDTTSSDAARP